MKKSIAIVTCGLMLAGTLGLAGCGGGTRGAAGTPDGSAATQAQQQEGQARLEDFVWYKAAIPEGFEPTNFAAGDAAYCIKLTRDKASLLVTHVSDDAESVHENWVANDGIEDLGTREIGDRTWYVAKEAKESYTTTYLWSDLTDRSSVCIEVTNMEPDDEAAQAFLKSFTPTADVEADYNRAIDMKYDDVVAGFGK